MKRHKTNGNLFKLVKLSLFCLFGHHGGERIEEDFFLNLSFARRRPKHHSRSSWINFWAALNKLILIVLAMLLASGRLFNSLSIGVHKRLVVNMISMKFVNGILDRSLHTKCKRVFKLIFKAT